MAENRGAATVADTCDVFCFDPERVNRLRPQVEGVRGLGDLFKSLADETRARIAFALSREELCVCDIATLLGMSVPAVSYHLRLLRAARVVRYRREGKQVYYSLDDSHVINVINEAVSHLGEGD
ncbi:MAG: winged helix-turn-helix transcriptional regulator [Firmicutes bacterium]|nr:winged helix-turn-helix transcriptional regulator [Bacillota bacterium]